jgi:glycerol-3-phosphate acyltransferase PlsY
MIEPAIVTTIAYLTGSIPTAYLLGRRLAGIDITRLGSGNSGTINAWRYLGWRAGIAVLVLDAAKGAAVMGLILALDLSESAALAAAIAVTLGHNFSVFMRFRGGKGVAVVFGLSLVVLPALTAVSLAVLPVTYYFTRGIVWSFLASFRRTQHADHRHKAARSAGGAVHHTKPGRHRDASLANP